MKKIKKNLLTIVMYVFAVLALGYTVYAAFQAYSTFTNYYSSSSIDVVNLIMYMISTAFEPLCFSVLFYGLGVVGEMLYKLVGKNEEKPSEK